MVFRLALKSAQLEVFLVSSFAMEECVFTGEPVAKERHAEAAETQVSEDSILKNSGKSLCMTVCAAAVRLLCCFW